METVGLTPEMGIVLAVLTLTILLFVSEIVRVDVAAVSIMVLLGALASIPGLDIIDVRHLFDGFASNAVISIIAVMIIGAGLDRTGVMSKVANWIMKVGGTTEQRTIPLISGSVGIISSFMQNVGAAALFLPVVARISLRTGLPMSRLLMPMGFCAILGGTMTMVGSSPLILLNDLLLSANQTLPSDARMATYQLFDVAPIGLVLVAAGIAYFVFFGSFVLPKSDGAEGVGSQSVAEYYNRVYGLDGTIYEVTVPKGSALVGKEVDEIQETFHLQVIATHYKGKTYIAPPRDVVIEAPATLALIAGAGPIGRFAAEYGLEASTGLDTFSETLVRSEAGIAELVIPPDSNLIGKTGRKLWFRKIFGLTPLAIHRGGETITRDIHDLGDIPYQAGDTLVCHTPWNALARLESNRNVVVVTTDYPRDEVRTHKVGVALLSFAIALGLVLFSDLRLSLCLLIGAAGMILGRVLSMDEAYEAISWKTVFLLASLIPLGEAVQSTGTAEWIAHQVLGFVGEVPTWTLQLVVALMATGFTLVMSNVGATVLLVPLAINIAISSGANPAVFALTVAIATSNSFLIPTHQVNALIMGPAGYRVIDFLRAGGIMTALFLAVSLVMLNLVY